jgi:hypothetical protein
MLLDNDRTSQRKSSNKNNTRNLIILCSNLHRKFHEIPHHVEYDIKGMLIFFFQ